ncbi:MAG: PilZ domain-containing protein [Planctomycetota bacterium]|nr:PilZ domain-containing protein [Planctomycetota bacterium]
MVSATEANIHATSERRRHGRVHLEMALQAVRLETDNVDVVDRLHMIDVSRGGVGAISDRSYYPGQRVLIYLPLTGQSGRRVLYATVRRCRRHAQGYHLGMEFDRMSLDTWYSQAGAAPLAA